jgi:choice-of-anchor B domain-containing protein
MRNRRLAFALGAALFVLGPGAAAQFSSKKVTLWANLDLTTLNCSNGNSCWGYVSPSGREYALMGCSNKVAFVDITNPGSPVYFASIPHTNSLWADVKVYSHYAYIVSEASGVGIQIVDLGNIDNHVVTLVRTLTNPGRSHNVSIDTKSGFLYTTGSNEGSGTTICYDLRTDPSNPTKVGPASMTPTYQHDIMPYSYTSGPYAGRQVLFGSSEGRGVEIYDVTDKNNPYLIKRVSYPYVGYCHQAWISRDEKYLYVDDEFDENNNGFTTRTIVMDVSSLENAFYVTTFTNGCNSIDHNQYWRQGFLFQANYRSGLRIYDVSSNPASPTEVGWFDTYPGGDGISYDGAWNNYPFFPSGTVIVSDINRGLFILNVDEAVTKTVVPSAYALLKGSLVSGGLPELSASDDGRMTIKAVGSPLSPDAPVQLELTAKSQSTDPRMLKFGIESALHAPNGNITIQLYNFKTGQYDTLITTAATTSDGTVEVEVPSNRSDYVNQSTLDVKALVLWRAPAPPTGWPFYVDVDYVYWTIRS